MEEPIRQTLAAFISKDWPTASQKALALEKGYRLIYVGDADVFSEKELLDKMYDSTNTYLAACVAHPAAALALYNKGFEVLIFENAGDQGVAKNLHVYSKPSTDNIILI